jgi:hypothetical protein
MKAIFNTVQASPLTMFFVKLLGTTHITPTLRGVRVTKKLFGKEYFVDYR